MRVTVSMIGKIISAIVSLYLIYIVIFGLLPYLFAKKVNPAYKRMLSEHEFSQRSTVDRVALVETPQDAFRWRMQLLNGAEETLDIAYHTIGSGETSQLFFGEVLRVANRGVKVRFIVDGKVGGMSGPHTKIAYALFTHPNIEYKVYNPLAFMTPWKWNSLLHDKFIIVDGRFMLLGGRNIGDIYFDPPGHQRRLTLDRDVFVFNTGFHTKISQDSVIADVSAYMDSLMSFKDSREGFRVLSATKRAIGQTTKEELITAIEDYEQEHPDFFRLPSVAEYYQKTVPTNGILLLHNPIDTTRKEPHVAYGIGQYISSAEKSVYLQTPYATGNKQLLEGLKKVSEKDIPFEMLTNSRGSTPNFPAFSNYYYNRNKFLDTGVTIFEFQQREEYPGGSIHAKSYLVDDTLSIVGSFNLDDRSKHSSTETMLVIHSPEFHEILLDTIQDWQKDSLVVGANNEYLPKEEQPYPQVEEKEASSAKKALLFVASIFSRIFQFLI